MLATRLLGHHFVALDSATVDALLESRPALASTCLSAAFDQALLSGSFALAVLSHCSLLFVVPATVDSFAGRDQHSAEESDSSDTEHWNTVEISQSDGQAVNLTVFSKARNSKVSKSEHLLNGLHDFSR